MSLKAQRTPTSPGMRLATEAQLTVLSFFELKELMSLSRVSRAWRALAETAVRRLERVVVGSILEERTLQTALRWCRTLRALVWSGYSQHFKLESLNQLLSQNSATLTSFSFVLSPSSSDCPQSLLTAIYGCSSLRRIDLQLIRLDSAATTQLVSSCPLLEDITLFADWEALLSAPEALPLRRLNNYVGWRQISRFDSGVYTRLLSKFPRLEEAHLSPGRVDLPTLFRGLRQLTRLERLFLEFPDPIAGAGTAAEGPVIISSPSLRFLELRCFFPSAKVSLQRLLAYFRTPGLRELRLRLGSGSKTLFALLIEHFPSLTALHLGHGDVETHGKQAQADAEAAVALLSQPHRPWKQLHRLALNVPGEQSFAPFVARMAGDGRLPALRELDVSGGCLACEDARRLLQELPSLAGLTISSTKGCVEDRCCDEVRRSGRLEAHGLGELKLKGVCPRLLLTLTAAARFPRLRRFEIRMGRVPVGSPPFRPLALLLDCRETLEELELRDFSSSFSFPAFPADLPVEQRAFPRLRWVVIGDGAEYHFEDDDVRRAIMREME